MVPASRVCGGSGCAASSAAFVRTVTVMGWLTSAPWGSRAVTMTPASPGATPRRVSWLPPSATSATATPGSYDAAV